jgi:hypothetical protein
MKARLFSSAALLFFVSISYVQAQVVLPERDEPDPGESVFGLGLFGGAASGLGLSFRHHLPSTISYQITGGIVKIDERLSYDIGGEVQFDLARSPNSRFFIAGGLGYYYSGKSDGNEMEAPARAALGIGGEFALSTGIHTSVEAMFTYFSDGTVLPLPQLGFHYYFY